MVETITPVVHGGHRAKWALAVGFHVLGTSLGALALGAALGLAGRALGAPWGRAGVWLVAAVSLVYAARELLGVGVPLPDRKGQVPEWWRTSFGPHVASFLYGLGLGVGFLTHLRHGTLVAVAALALAGGDPLAGALVMLPFGLARGLTVLMASPGERSDAVARIMSRLDAWALSDLPRILNGAALVVLAAVVAVGPPGSGQSGGPSVAGEVLAGVFAWAALSKLTGFRRWRDELGAYRLPGNRLLAVAIPAAELAVAALALASLAVPAVVMALTLLAGFCAAILRARRFHGDRLPCGCFGGRTRRDFRALLARNAALAGLAVIALPDDTAALTTMGPAHVLPIALLTLGLGLAALLAREARRLMGGRLS